MVTKGNITIEGINPNRLMRVIEKLRNSEVDFNDPNYRDCGILITQMYINQNEYIKALDLINDILYFAKLDSQEKNIYSDCILSHNFKWFISYIYI